MVLSLAWHFVQVCNENNRPLISLEFACPLGLPCIDCWSQAGCSVGRDCVSRSAEGATAPETLRHKGPTCTSNSEEPLDLVDQRTEGANRPCRDGRISQVQNRGGVRCANARAHLVTFLRLPPHSTPTGRTAVSQSAGSAWRAGRCNAGTQTVRCTARKLRAGTGSGCGHCGRAGQGARRQRFSGLQRRSGRAAGRPPQLAQPDSADRPFVIRYGWTNGGGHIMVGRGYQTYNGVNYLYIMDPWPGEGMTYRTYNSAVHASDHRCTHTQRMNYNALTSLRQRVVRAGSEGSVAIRTLCRTGSQLRT
jgi:hypothetical protein